ncbi:MauE/DoxX family redox-associated membrane protein [Corynebacterium aquilae]|uniref:DoxX family protein n=1 Tax=Corynebacterium aquilae DSM 44791 TaxID=1431546 RepID=A0A1L7CHS3_9CORY|nr:MauE/DoxX family redox-associated membrane protein [Corynebacterium aquilae]APT85369.1 DoxX family protein [Corynebacterium aquilae DSM 44791]
MPHDTASARATSWRDWLSMACRFGLALVWIISGATKITEPVATKQSVAAYELFSQNVSDLIATVLPPVEIALGVLILLGIALRWLGGLSALIFLGFIAGIASAWARGLTIDCGCFGAGGYNEDVTWWTYASEILRDTIFVAMAVITARRPWTKLAVWP